MICARAARCSLWRIWPQYRVVEREPIVGDIPRLHDHQRSAAVFRRNCAAERAEHSGGLRSGQARRPDRRVDAPDRRGFPPRLHGPRRLPGRPRLQPHPGGGAHLKELRRSLARRDRPAARPRPAPTLVRPEGFLPPAPKTAGRRRPESNDTTHYSVVDAEGNAVAVTTTLNDAFGSRVTAGSLGFLLNDEMDDFAAKAGRPQSFRPHPGPGQRHRPRQAPARAP